MTLWPIDIRVMSDLVLIVLCIAVLVQTMRVLAGFRRLRSGGLAGMVEAMNQATADAALVLGDLRRLLATEGADHARALAKAEGLHAELGVLRDELAMMSDIGEGVARRIMEAADAARTPPAAPDHDRTATAPLRVVPAC